jgi:hypothetical protein
MKLGVDESLHDKAVEGSRTVIHGDAFISISGKSALSINSQITRVAEPMGKVLVPSWCQNTRTHHD